MSDEPAARDLPRRERERLTHRREILEAAERVFARQGYRGATVEGIAREAEFAVGTLYNFFRSKDSLYEAVVTELADEFMAAFRTQVLGHEDPAAAIGALIELRFGLVDKHRGFARVFFEPAIGGPIDPVQGLPEGCASVYEEGIVGVSAIFRRGIDQGLFIDVDPIYLTLSLHGMMNAFITYWTRREPEEPLAGRVSKLKELFIGRILKAGA